MDGFVKRVVALAGSVVLAVALSTVLIASPASAVTATEQGAATWARAQTGSTAWRYKCLAFVYQAYISSGVSRASIDANAGYVATSNSYPIDEWNYWMSGHLPAGQLHQGYDASPPAGAIIYFSNRLGHDYSHATISIAGGQQISPDTTAVSGPQPVNSNSYRTMLGWWLPDATSSGGGGGSTLGGSTNLARDGGFEGGGGWSAMSSTNFVVYRNGQQSGVSAKSGLHYGATNTSAGGGGIYEDVALSTSAGDVVCASAWVRNQDNVSAPATGTFAVWLLWGANENGTTAYSAVHGSWRQVHTCVSASSSHSVLRLQFYPTPGSHTVLIDDIDAHRSLARDGGFEGGGGWSAMSSTNFVVYRNGQQSGVSAKSGLHYGATNTSAGGGGIYEDVALSTSAGDVVCASAWVRNQDNVSAPATGTFAVWLLWGANENGTTAYSAVHGSWRQVHTCVSASSSHSVLRLQFYPTPGSHTVLIDDIDAHRSLARDGGFEGDGGWSAMSSTNFVVYRNGQQSGVSAKSGLHYGATNTSAGGGGIYEDVALSTSAGDVVCASAWVRNQDNVSAPATGTFAVWLLWGANENGTTAYSAVHGSWRQVHTCVSASSSHSVLRLQFYPTPGSHTVLIDDIDAH